MAHKTSTVKSILGGLKIAVPGSIVLAVGLFVLTNGNKTQAVTIDHTNVVTCDTVSGIKHKNSVQLEGISMFIQGKASIETDQAGNINIKMYSSNGQLHYSCAVIKLVQ